ncbi:TIGR04222 domain-containing membrane protein [Geodermatophilus marinus]|nr:TIGR04222 domain-containing membrane protein [Geodermatophilus sp. LHW52908]
MSTTADRSGTVIGVHEAAYLTGGPARVVDAAVAALVRAGRVRVTAPGELAAAAPARQEPVEAAVLDGIGTAGHRSIDTVRWRLVADPRITGLAHRLEEQGLLRRRLAPAARRGDAPAEVPTREGRRVIAALRTQHAGDDVWRVALDGPAAARDERLRAAIDPSGPTADVSRRADREALRRLAESDPATAAQRTWATAVGGGVLGLGVDAGGGDVSGVGDGGGGGGDGGA